jgi:hypothetical protein
MYPDEMKEESKRMKQACCVALIITMISPTLLHAQRPGGVCRLINKYDRGADLTTVQCDLIESVETTGRLIVQASASFRGKEPNETAKFWFGLASYKGSATRHTQPLFQNAATLILMVDSTRLEVPVKDYRNEFFELNRLLAEQARAEVGPEDLQKILDAKHLAGKWGNAEFKFSDTALASLKDFISRQVFAASTR